MCVHYRSSVFSRSSSRSWMKRYRKPYRNTRGKWLLWSGMSPLNLSSSRGVRRLTFTPYDNKHISGVRVQYLLLKQEFMDVLVGVICFSTLTSTSPARAYCVMMYQLHININSTPVSESLYKETDARHMFRFVAVAALATRWLSG